MKRERYLTAQEAAATLGISPTTLYAYVSRGLVRSEAIAADSRNRQYHQEDIQRLKERKELRRNPTKAVAQALHWGEPVLDSAITLISNGRLYYRGCDAIELAETRTVEEVASLIWLGELTKGTPVLFDAASSRASFRCLATRRRVADLPPIDMFQAILPVAAAEDIAAYDVRPLAVAQTGARILGLLALIAAGRDEKGADIAHTLQDGWAPEDPAATRLLGAALVLCADHELNVSTFTARCVASAGSTSYAVVMAGLSALQGVKHGGGVEQVEAFLREVGTPGQAPAVIAHRLKRGERLPGFGHQLYPDGDPRGKALLALTTNAYPESPAVVLGDAVVTQVYRAIGQHPTVDFGLAVLANALQQPPGAALALFAIGRTIGWIGHAIEQYQTDQLIRPRARYTGPAPGQ
jgi:citrate synthase